MNHWRSALVGLGFAAGAVAVNLVVTGVLLAPRLPEGTGLGWDPAVAARSPGLWVIAAMFFVAGTVRDMRRRAR